MCWLCVFLVFDWREAATILYSDCEMLSKILSEVGQSVLALHIPGI